MISKLFIIQGFIALIIFALTSSVNAAAIAPGPALLARQGYYERAAAPTTANKKRLLSAPKTDSLTHAPPSNDDGCDVCDNCDDPFNSTCVVFCPEYCGTPAVPFAA